MRSLHVTTQANSPAGLAQWLRHATDRLLAVAASLLLVALGANAIVADASAANAPPLPTVAGTVAIATPGTSVSAPNESDGAAPAGTFVSAPTASDGTAPAGSFVSAASGITYRHGIAYLSEPEYPAGFTHFRYANADAPKGGRIRVGDMGNWDTFIETPPTGRPVQGASVTADPGGLIYDSLLVAAIDTLSDRYGRLAEGVAEAPDGSWVAFKLRPGARWHDGKPITMDDYRFSFEVYTKLASPSFQQSFAPFERLEVLNDSELRYWIRAADRGLPGLAARIGSMAVLPAHYWATRDIGKSATEPPLGSGPYRIGSFRAGKTITYERVPDYWGKDLPVNRGRYNFDTIVYDYFRDDQVLYEAVKGDLLDIREETVPVRWATGYETPAVARGDFIKEPMRLLRPSGLWWPIFWNMRVPRFQDIRVREALWLLRDGNWANRVGSYGFWDLPTSFFHDSVFAHKGPPSPAELALLEPIRHLVPPRVFTDEFKLHPDDGKGWSRRKYLQAFELMKDAGWVIRDNVLVNEQTGEPFEIRFLAVSAALGGSFIPYMQILKKIGIASTVASPEISSWQHRSRTGDFDGGAIWFLPDNTPGLLISNTFSSKSLGDAYSPNWAGINDPALDKLIGDMEAARTLDDFITAVRCIDRVLMWNFYFAPVMSRAYMGMVHWDRFGKPEHGRLVRPAMAELWWWDPDKAARVAAAGGG